MSAESGNRRGKIRKRAPVALFSQRTSSGGVPPVSSTSVPRSNVRSPSTDARLDGETTLLSLKNASLNSKGNGWLTN